MTTSPSLFTASHVANFILEKAAREKLPVTQLKLLKLVYLVYGWVLAVLDERLFDEPIQAWKLGPVVPSLYHEFKRFGKNPITEKSIYMDEEGQVSYPFLDADESTTLVMTKAWEVYSPFTASALVNKTHEPESPWFKYYTKEAKHIPIPDEEIKEYFVKKISEYTDA